MAHYPSRLSSLEHIVPLSNSAEDIASNQILKDSVRAAGDTDVFTTVVISPDEIVPDPRDEPFSAEYVTVFSHDHESLETEIHSMTARDPRLEGVDTEIYRGQLSSALMRFAGRQAILDEADTMLAVQHTLPDGVLGAKKHVLLSAVEHRRHFDSSGRNHQFYTALVVPRSFQLSLANLHQEVDSILEYEGPDAVSRDLQELVQPDKRTEMATHLAFSVSYMMHLSVRRWHEYSPQNPQSLQIPINN